MYDNAQSIRPFIGAKNYETSRRFYRDLGFEEIVLSGNMSVFKAAGLAFYLQDADVKDWIDNSQVFMEIDGLDSFWNDLATLDLPGKYPGVRLSPIKIFDWGRECYLHDPSGILWHFGQFFTK